MNTVEGRLATVPTAVGAAVVIEDSQGRLRLLDWADNAARWQRLWQRHAGRAPLLEVDTHASAQALRAYLAGDWLALAALPRHTAGSPFQQLVWSALLQIPPGQSISYAELARRIGRPSAVRAVAAANAANPISIAVPCHRVIGSDGQLTGYAGGLRRKAWLLQHEAGAA